MPTYDYRCRKCGHRFELFLSIKDDRPKRCPKCRSRADRVPSAGAGVLFKGSGFYITDYRSQGYKDQAKQERGTSGGSSSEGGGTSSDAKPKPKSKSGNAKPGGGGRKSSGSSD
jgi:putative FmdB family regulatory protein